MPKKAETHILTRAPGPPETIAVATPLMLPVPTVLARAVQAARKPETVPSPSPFAPILAKVFLKLKAIFHWYRKENRMLKMMPTPTSRIVIQVPHIKSSIMYKKSVIAAISLPLCFSIYFHLFLTDAIGFYLFACIFCMYFYLFASVS